MWAEKAHGADAGCTMKRIRGQAYWRKLKQRLKDEGNETVTNCHALKMRAADGKMRVI